MAATTTLLGLVTPTQGTLTGTWGDTVNYGISDYLDIAIAGTLSFAGDGAITLANTTGSSSGNSIGATTAQYAIIRVTGTLTTAKIITGPSYSKTYLVVNAATGSTVTFKASGQTGVSIAVGETALVYYNGTDYVKVVGTATAGAAGGSNTQVQYNNSGVLAGITGATTNGTALTLVAPVLGTPASGTVTNLTGTASININGTVGATTPGTGAFTTLDSTGAITSTATGAILIASGATTANKYIQLINSGGSGLITKESSVGGTILPGSTAYALAISTNTNTPVQIGVNSVLISTFSSTGLAVTGTLSATGTLSGGTSGTAYSFSGSAPANSLALNSSGQLGIGISATAALTVGTGGALRLYRTDNATYTDIYSTTGASGGCVLNNANGDGFSFQNSATTAMRLDSAGNLGLGVTPVNAYTTFGYKNYELPLAAFASFDVGLRPILQLKSNVYYDSGGATKYISYGYATQYTQDSGGHIWYTAASGTANNAVSFTQAMTLDASGNLGIGTTTITSGAGWTPRLVLADATAPAMILKGSNSQEASIGSVNGMFIDCLGSSTGTNNNIIFRNTSVNSSFTATERARIDTSGNLLVGVATANANGGVLQLKSGITFPATAVAATDANTMDDYEEGTWTPVYQGSTGSAGTAAYTSDGYYTKIGRLVNLNCRLDITNVGSWTNNFQISGVPFTGGASNADYHGVTRIAFTTFGALVSYYVARLPSGATTLDLPGIVTAAQISLLQTSGLSSSSVVIVEITYFV